MKLQFPNKQNKNQQTQQKMSNVKLFPKRKIQLLYQIRIKMMPIRPLVKKKRPLVKKKRLANRLQMPKVESNQTWLKALALQMMSESKARISI